MRLVAAALVGLVPAVVAYVILRHHPRHRIGWLLLAHAVCAPVMLLGPAGNGVSSFDLAVDQLTAGLWPLLFLFLVVSAYLLPDGHPMNRRWRWWIRVGLGGFVLFAIGAAGDGDFAKTHPGHAAPVPWLPPTFAGLLGVAGLLVLVSFLFGAVPAVALRLRRAHDDNRLALLWFVWGALSIPLALLLNWVGYFVLDDHTYGVTPFVTEALLGSALPVTIGIAILRWRLYDIQVVLSRTLVYAVLILLVAGVYAGLLALAQQVGGSRTAGDVVAVVVLAVAVAPTQAFLQRRITRWVYGYRREPHEALRLLSRRADEADPLHLVDEITTTIAEALKVARVWVEEGEPEPGERILRIPLTHRGTALGSLAVEQPAGRQFSAADTALLHDLARQAAVLVRAGQLTRDLQHSRSALVSAREEERRRLRRDLHDGVGPSLAAIVLKLNAAQSRTDEAARNAVLAETREETKAAIAEVRRLVDDLRPPAIDEVGLLAAIRQRAAAVTGDRLRVDVRGPEALPALPAAVEVAAFRIASEAVTNVARHSGASRCVVEIAVNGAFELSIADNGTGAASKTGSGVGWTSMRERAAELGGSCTISSRAEGGMVVRAVLPLDEQVEEVTA
ncbi:GAF domain-containing sensor histidine kinase [Nocardioides sp. Kera G14]|uniref:GAF domain-containing sensor histidine kinase n=1 Tax=Nocardioides sp. Kera G14 TaxID=2884264 RepID=UPI001D110740|nr:GAF domain-containing sensor histidine kinase [Nocardioides sp. Kera G14]UDY22892.1 GAF domain-containing sensor histidine kinase [Nocardioides sp. Kera G14]